MTSFMHYQATGAGTAVRVDTQIVLHSSSKETGAMLLYEELARARMREAEQDAARRRLAYQLVTARRWRRLADWARHRANEAEARI
jgi:hypothetical protein